MRRRELLVVLAGSIALNTSTVLAQDSWYALTSDDGRPVEELVTSPALVRE